MHRQLDQWFMPAVLWNRLCTRVHFPGVNTSLFKESSACQSCFFMGCSEARQEFQFSNSSVLAGNLVLSNE